MSFDAKSKKEAPPPCIKKMHATLNVCPHFHLWLSKIPKKIGLPRQLHGLSVRTRVKCESG